MPLVWDSWTGKVVMTMLNALAVHLDPWFEANHDAIRNPQTSANSILQLILDLTRNLRVISEEVMTLHLMCCERIEDSWPQFLTDMGCVFEEAAMQLDLFVVRMCMVSTCSSASPFSYFIEHFRGMDLRFFEVTEAHWSLINVGLNEYLLQFPPTSPPSSPSRRNLQLNENNYTRNFNQIQCISLIQRVTNEDARSAGGWVCIYLDSKPPAIQVGRFQLIMEIICQNPASNLAFVPGPGFKLGSVWLQEKEIHIVSISRCITIYIT